MRVVGEASNVDDAIAIIAQMKPDVITLDLSFEGVDDMASLSQMRQHFPALPILIVSVHAEERYALRALRMGASGYVTKSMAVDEVVAALRKVAAGGRYVSPRLGELLASNMLESDAAPPHQALTNRELQVLRMLGSGKAIKQIASECDISISSVHTYRARIFKKTGLKTNAEVIRYALNKGLID